METNPPSSVSVSLKRNAASMDADDHGGVAASAKRVRSDEPPPDHPHSASPFVKAQAVTRTVEFALKRSPSSSVPAAPAESGSTQLQADPPPPATTTAAGPTAAHDPDIDAAFRAAVLAKLAESSSGSSASAPSTASTRTGPLPPVHDPSPVQKAEEEEEGEEEETDDPDAERSDGGWDDEDEWVPPPVAGNSSAAVAPEHEQPSANGQSLISPPPTPVPTVRTDAASPLPPTVPAPPPEPTPDATVAAAIATEADVDMKSAADDAAPAPELAEPGALTAEPGDVDDDWLEAVAPSNFALPDESFWAPPTSPPTLPLDGTDELSPLTQPTHPASPSLASSPPPISALLNPSTDAFHPSSDASHPSTNPFRPPTHPDDDDEYADSGDELNAALAAAPVAPGFVARGSDGAKVQCAACGKWMSPGRTAGHVARLCGTLPDPARGRKAKRRSTSSATPRATRASTSPKKQPRVPKTPRVPKPKPERVVVLPAARLAARRAELDADRWAAQVDDARGVRCAACGAWVDVGGSGLGAVQRWSGRTGHKSVCAEIVETVRREEAEAKLRELTHAHEAPAPVPPALLADRRVRRIDGDQAQCDVCGVWTLFKNWDAHQGVRCEQIRARRDAKAARREAKAARRASPGGAVTGTGPRNMDALSDLSSDSEFETRRDLRWVGGPGAKLRAEALAKAAAAAAASASGSAGASGSGSGAVGAAATASGAAPSTTAAGAGAGASASTTATVSAPTAAASTTAIPTAAASGSASLATTATTVSVAVPAAATAKGASTAKATATSTSTPKAATTSAATNGTASAAKKGTSSAAGSASKAAPAASSSSRLAHPWPTLAMPGALPAGVPRPWMTDPRYGLGVIPQDMLQKMYPGFVPAGYVYDPAQAAKGKGKGKGKATAAAPPRAAASSSTLRPELLSATVQPFPLDAEPKAAPAPASGKRAAGPSTESPAAKKAKAEAGPPKKKTLPLASILAEAEARADAAAAAAATAGPSAASSSAPAAPSATKKQVASPAAAPRVAVAAVPKRYGGVIELPKAAKIKYRAARQAEIAREAAQRSARAAEAEAAPANAISEEERKEWSNAPLPYARKGPGARAMQLHGTYRLCGLKVSVSSSADRNTTFVDDLPSDPEQLLRYERQVILHYDADVARVGEDNTVQCKGCSSWVKLPTSGAPTKKWYGRTGHKSCCQGNIERRQAAAAQPVAEVPEVVFHKPFRIRRVKGDKVQCAGCGKNVSAPMWARHLDERCTFYTVPPAGPKPDSSDSDSEAFESWMSAQAATNGKPQLPLDVTIAKRRAQLLEDAAVREIGDDKLLCDPCGQWIKISKHLYAEHKWYGDQGHRNRCIAQHPNWKPRADKDELTPSPATSVPGSPAKAGSSAAPAASTSLAIPLRAPKRPTQAPPSSPPSVIVIPDTSSDHEVHDDDEEYNPDEDDSGAESESSEDPELDV